MVFIARSKAGNYFGKAYQEYGDKICFTIGIYGEYSIDVFIVEPGDFATDFMAKRIKAYGAECYESAYRKACRCALNKIEKDESGGCHPDIFAIAMKKIIEARHRKMRYMMGDPMQKSSVMLNRRKNIGFNKI